MQKLFLIIGGLIVVVAVALGIWFAPQQRSAEPGNKISVGATIFPLGDIAGKIGGDRVEVITILPSGASPHTFQVSPSVIRDLSRAGVIFAIGHDLDHWTQDISSALDVNVVTVDSGIRVGKFLFEHEEEDDEEEEDHKEGENDPHYWLSPVNGMQIAKNIAEQLMALDSANESYYRQNLEEYIKAIDEEYEALLGELAVLENRDLIVFHESWNYFANDFNLNIVGVFESAPGREPSPSYLAELQETAREHGVPAVFSEPQLSPSTVRPFVEDLGLELYVMDPIGGIGERDSYLNLLRYNVETIIEAYTVN